ncbi:FHA domain-containing protein [Nostoc sp. KVJ3]|uniref:FHA domain-containing protein n=1 Tax=Nostoc sp. KVJ3 TaxID=457945 RepID=UPI002237D787|nr:FHA domain-containing protein [Nostoc sp. KVJ3]MCW5317094.1 FHA domain-containing protein [Nostoc sp. KVJ3]
MSIYQCPKGHESTELDFCSECGTKILGVPELPFVQKTIDSTVTPTKTTENCPDCSTAHEPNSGNFCEICGYNFVTGSHGEVPIAKRTQEEEMATKRQTNTNSSESGLIDSQLLVIGWDVVVYIDPSLRHPESPEPPINQPPITFHLDKTINLIGRNSEVRAIHPEIALDFDDAVSHRHALLTLETDNTLTLRDIGSANGTQLKAVELKPMVDIKLQDGDEFTLGHWTRIAVKAVRKLG